MTHLIYIYKPVNILTIKAMIFAPWPIYFDENMIFTYSYILFDIL